MSLLSGLSGLLGKTGGDPIAAMTGRTPGDAFNLWASPSHYKGGQQAQQSQPVTAQQLAAGLRKTGPKAPGQVGSINGQLGTLGAPSSAPSQFGKPTFIG